MNLLTILSNIIDTINLLIYPYFCDNSILLLTTNTFDFIIVGAGSAGAVVASRLSENPSVKVLLLEAGGCQPITGYIPATDPFMLHTNVDWGFKVASQNNSFLSYPNHQINYSQGKVFGGSSTINGMVYVRGNQENYNNWAKMGNTGWDWKGVLPYYLRAEANTIPSQASDVEYHNTTGPLYVSQAPFRSPIVSTFLQGGVEKGYPTVDINGPNQTGFSENQYTMWNGERWSTYSAYIKPAENRFNLVRVSGAFVTKVILNNNRAVGVQFTTTTGTHTNYASKEVILSAGAIGSPKILQLSGIGDPAELAKFNIPLQIALPGVGKNFHDHVGCPALMWKVNCTDCTYSVQNASSLYNIFNYVLFRNGPVTIPLGIQALGFIYTKYGSVQVPDVELQLVTANLADNLQMLTSLFGIDQSILQQYYGVFANSLTFNIFIENLYPKSRGTLTLASSNPLDPPIINFNYFTVQQDILVLIEAVKLVIDIVTSPAFQAVGAVLNPTPFPGCNMPPNTDAYYECLIRNFPWTSWHAGGSCKMGNSSDPMAVVDPQLLVYNMTGLRVIDASIMPEVVAGNTNAAAIMIGEKGAAMIKTFYKI